MAAQSFAKQILDEVVAQLKTQRAAGAFGVVTGDTCQALLDDAIVIKKLIRRRREHEQADFNVMTPGILVGLMGTATRPQDGVNAKDDTQYVLVAQIVDHDNWEDDENLDTYLLWSQNVRKTFNNNYQKAFTGGDVYQTVVRELDPVEERQWINHQHLVMAIEMTFICRESRSIVNPV